MRRNLTQWAWEINGVHPHLESKVVFQEQDGLLYRICARYCQFLIQAVVSMRMAQIYSAQLDPSRLVLFFCNAHTAFLIRNLFVVG
jgi:hypothetical protein